MPTPIVIASTATVELQPHPIAPGWILSGTPEARAILVAVSKDHTTHHMIWDCTPGRFNWQYFQDETVVIISGEVFITDDTGAERRLAAGDVALFPAGSSCTWRVTNHVRKVAVVRLPVPSLLALGVRAWHKLLRIMGIGGSSSLAMPFLYLLAGV
jgi:uncharacterized protein